MNKVETFGEYLKELRKKKNITFTGFKEELNVSKTYLLEIEKNMIKPPTKEMQFRMVKILQLADEEKYEFFDKAAVIRCELPADIYEYITENPDAIDVIREAKKDNKRISIEEDTDA